MTIQTAILAKSPDLYWPLDDATGPLSADLGTGGHPGFYGGNFLARAPGPEAGTYGVRLLNPYAYVWSNPQPFGNVWPLSFSVWAAIDQWNPSANAIMWWADFGLKGFAVTLNYGQGFNNQLGINRYNVGQLLTDKYVKDADWHHYVLVQGAGGTLQFQLYVDGALQYTSATGYNFVPANTGTLGIGGAGGYWAHFARFPSALSAADIATIYGARVGPASAPSATGALPTADSAALATANDLLSQILAAVRRTF